MIGLIGFSYSGKTTVAKKLSGIIGYACLDLDLMISDEVGTSVACFIRDKGIEAFRTYEKSIFDKNIKNLSDNERVVIAFGGGAPLIKEVNEWLKSRSHIVWLRVSESICMKRRLISKEERPLLDSLEDCDKFIQERNGIYSGVKPALVIDTDDLSIDEVCSCITDYLKTREKM